MKTEDGRIYPDSLVDLPIWVLWRLEEDKKGNLTKVPYSGRYFGRASSTDPLTWSSYYQASMKWKGSGGYYNGIGICVQKSDRLVFTDIDHCIDEEGNLSETAQDIVDHSGGQYIEKSQSGTGIHILSLGEIPRNFKNSDNGVEMYAAKRFVAMTGDVLFSGDPHEDPEGLKYIFEKYKTPEKKKVVRQPVEENPFFDTTDSRTDLWVIEHAMKRGIFSDLFMGNWGSLRYKSQSEADLSLCNILAFWTDCDPVQMDRIFRASSLYREKWDRDDYRIDTINAAISNCDMTLSEYIREEDRKFEQAILERW